jgi:hypothetical protein
MKKVLYVIKDAFKNIDYKSKRTWVLFGLLVMIGLLSTLYISYGYYLNSGTKNVVISGKVSFGDADLTLQIYMQDRDSYGAAISNSYTRAYYIPKVNYSYEPSKTVCGTGITLTYDSTTYEFEANTSQKGICKVYFAANGTVVPNATFSLNVEDSLNSGKYTKMGSLPNNNYVYEINGARTSCTDPYATLSIMGRKIIVESSADLDCDIYVDVVSTINASTHIEESIPAGYIGSSNSNNSTQNLYRFTGSYQSSDSAYAGHVDNYICLGSDASSCPADNIYRIIGIVAEDDSTTGLSSGMIKVIKNTSIGNYTWDGGTSLSDANKNVNSSNYETWRNGVTSSSYDPTSGRFPMWSQSYLNTGILNSTYYNNLPFKDIIANVKWHCYSSNTTPTAATEYSASLCSNTPSKIGLIYVGDYLNAYNDGTNTSSSSYIPWLQNCTSTSYTGSGFYLNECGSWSIANYGFYYESSSSYYWYTWDIRANGNLSVSVNYLHYGSGSVVANAYPVRPVFYLTDNIAITSGSGTYADPFRI